MLDLPAQPHWLGLPLAYWWLLGVMFGGGTGGFLAVAIERLPARAPLTGRSHCTCGRQLLWWENIPVLSWLALRGRASCCRTRIPVRYEITESGVAAVWVACFSLPTLWQGVAAAVGCTLAILTVAVLARARQRRTAAQAIAPVTSSRVPVR